MSIWTSVDNNDDTLATAFSWHPELGDSCLELFLDVATSVASREIRVICDLDAEAHIRNHQPYDAVYIVPRIARDLARRLVIAADLIEPQ